jgi:superkiller protein 3
MTSRLALIVVILVVPGASSTVKARSEQALRQAIAQGGDTAELHGELGLLLYRAGRFHDAILELGRAAQLDPSAPEYSLKLAASILAERRYSVALEFLRSIASRFEKLAEYQYNVGLAYYGLRKYDSALEVFQQAVRIAPDMDLAHFFVANSYVANADPASAIPHYRKALALNSKKAGYYYGLGKTLGEMGPAYQREAMTLLRTALKLKPDDTASKFALAALCERRDDTACALPLLESVVARYPDEIAPRVVLGRIFTKLGEPEKAKQQFEAVRRLEASRSGSPANAKPGPEDVPGASLPR